MDFLPENYEAPKTSNNYLKLQEGDNKIRILSRPVVGYEDWVENKPIRYSMNDKPMRPHDSKKPIRHFWAMIVWDYVDSKIKILHITQATIRSTIEALARNTDWGVPYAYDITISKKGNDLKSEYSVTPSPKKNVSNEIINEFKNKPINLNALFRNEDPFSILDEVTKGMFHEEQSVLSVNIISSDQHRELILIFAECESTFERDLKEKVSKADVDFKDWKNLKSLMYEKVKLSALKNRDEYKTKEFDIF